MMPYPARSPTRKPGSCRYSLEPSCDCSRKAVGSHSRSPDWDPLICTWQQGVGEDHGKQS